jgi:hypothetical protein
MRGVWQQCCLAKPASMGGNRRSVGDPAGSHTSFHWVAFAKRTHLRKDFVVTILCTAHAVDAFGSRSPLTTTTVMSRHLAKYLRKQVPVPRQSNGIVFCVMQHMCTHCALHPRCPQIFMRSGALTRCSRRAGRGTAPSCTPSPKTKLRRLTHGSSTSAAGRPRKNERNWPVNGQLKDSHILSIITCQYSSIMELY